MENGGYWLHEAVECYNKEDYQQAIDILTENNVQKTDAAAYYELMGYCYYQLNQFENAAWYLDKAIVHKPDSGILHDWLGLAYARAGQDEKALKEILYLYNTYPNNDLYTYRYGYFEYTHERLDSALKLLLEAFELNPDVQEYLCFFIGACYYKLNAESGALEYLEKHAEKHPEFPDTYYLLGCIYDRMDETDKALSYLSQALWYKEDYEDALFNRFRIKKDTCDYEGAEKDLIRLMQLSPGYIQLKDKEGNPLRVTSIKIDRTNGNVNFTLDTESPAS